MSSALPSYDQNQIDTVLRQCPDCRRWFYMRPKYVTCVECRGWPHVGKVNP